MSRPAIDRSLLFFAVAIKVYVGATNRKAIDKIRQALGTDEWDEREFHFNRLSEYLNQRETTRDLYRAIAEICSPFAAFAEDVILDGTGISLTSRGTYRSEQYPQSLTAGRQYARLNLAMDRVLKIFPGAIVTPMRGKGTGELTQAPELLRRLEASGWQAKRILADGLYAVEPFFSAVEEYGAEPIVPLRRIYNEKRLPKSPLMLKVYRQFKADPDAFYEIYRLRPLVESGISSLKRKFAGSVRSKTIRAQMNEILLKVLCHNIDCVIHATHRYGLSIEQLIKML